MLRFAVLTVLTAFIWFVLNDGQAVTKSTPASGSAAFILPVKLVDVVPEDSIAPKNIVARQDMIFAQAQSQPPAQTRSTRKPRARTSVTIYSYRSMVRDCVDWYAQEHRPSGTVIVPRMRCRWVRR